MTRALATLTLIGINATVFGLMAWCNPLPEWDGDYLLRWGADFGALTLHGEIWRLLASTFIHTSLFHVAINMTFLLYWGSKTESVFGSSKFLLIYVLGGVTASLTSVIASPQIVSAGSSGATNALLGAMCVIWLRGNRTVSTMEIMASVVLSVSLSLLPASNWLAHLGGFVSGLCIAILLSSKLRESLAANGSTQISPG